LSLKVIAPTVVPVGRSFVIDRFAAAAGKMSESAAAGVPEGDQFEGLDQFELTAPVQDRVTANPGKQMNRQISDRSAARLWTMNGIPRH